MNKLTRIITIVIAALLCISAASCSTPAAPISSPDTTATASIAAETAAPSPSEAPEPSPEVPSTPSPETTAAPSPSSSQGGLPASYDPRPDGTSAVRDQQWGICWALGGISTLESRLIQTSLADKDISLSAEDVLWWANCSPDGYGWTNMRRNDGGYAAMITGYMQTVGARSAEDIPDLGAPSDPEDILTDFYGEGENQRPENYDTAPVIYDVTDIIFIDEADPEEIKSIITEYGALTVSYYDDPDFFNEDTAAYWCPEDASEIGNHTVSVIGWDDAYPRENFKEADGRLPDNDGAWLIKNSYGTDYGSEGGFIYISYEDSRLFITEEYNYMYAVSGVRRPLQQKVYSHDEFGAVSFWQPDENGSAVWANIYDFGPSEKINEISFVTMSKGAEYRLFYAPIEEGIPSADSALWAPLASGTIGHGGYITVSADNAEIPEGPGAIVLSLEGERADIGTDENLLHYGRPMFNAKVDAGAAFFMRDGAFIPAERTKTAGDITFTEAVDICLRAYTVPR